MFTHQELIEQFPHTFCDIWSLIRTTLMSVKVVFHSSSIDHCSMCHTFWLYNLPSLGQSSSLLMKASCCEVETSWDRLLLVVSNHLMPRATIYSNIVFIVNHTMRKLLIMPSFILNHDNGNNLICTLYICMYFMVPSQLPSIWCQFSSILGILKRLKECSIMLHYNKIAGGMNCPNCHKSPAPLKPINYVVHTN